MANVHHLLLVTSRNEMAVAKIGDYRHPEVGKCQAHAIEWTQETFEKNCQSNMYDDIIRSIGSLFYLQPGFVLWGSIYIYIYIYI